MAGASRPASEASQVGRSAPEATPGNRLDCPADGRARESPRPSDVRPSQRRGSGRQRRSGMIGRDRQAALAVARSPRSTERSEERGTVRSELSAEQTRLAQLWEEHMRHEFQTCSTEDTLATMVEDAYVNHVPVMTGGEGHAELRPF